MTVKAFRATEAVELDGEEYTMFIDLSVIDGIEDDLDMGFLEIMAKIGSGLRLAKLVRVYHALLVTKHPELHVDEVATLAFQHGAKLLGAMERLSEKAWPEQAAETKGGNPPKARRGTGDSSLSNGARKVSRRATSGNKPPELSASS